MTVEPVVIESRDQFPIGMRVLAVDDDPPCLMVLERLLQRCQYHVTATSQATTALRLLRENKDKFDLVISDVHMPDMDGFKLLELVGLEMDLPVIMLSGNGDPKLVMKGITHGACDYLLKPIRIEELQNIWQHVVRRKKGDPRDRNDPDSQSRPHVENCDAGMGNSDQNGKLNKKRKDQNEDEEEDRYENEDDSDDPSAQKKPRVVWSVELHRKFVGAVNQLGIDKAVPKKILDLMNVEKLTRENVASHLQKYRLYLKRISCVANQQANMAAALGSTDSPYLRISSLNGLGTFNTTSGAVQFQNPSFRSFLPSGMLGRLNSPAGLGMRGLPSSGMVQLGHAQNLGNSATDQGKFQLITHPGNQNGSILQGMPMSVEVDQRQFIKGGNLCINELPTAIDNPTGFPVSSGFPDSNISVGNIHNPILGVTNNQFLLDAYPPEAQNRNMFRNQSSVVGTSLSSGFSTHLSDQNRCNDNWSGAVQSSAAQLSSYPLTECFEEATLHPNNMLQESGSSIGLHTGNTGHDLPCISPGSIRLPDSDMDLLGQASLMRSNTGQETSRTPQGWNDHRQNAAYQSNILCDSTNSTSPIYGSGVQLSQNLNSANTNFNRNMDFDSMRQSNYFDSVTMKHNNVFNPTMEMSINLKEGFLMGHQKSNNNYVSSNNVGSLDDLVGAMVKREHHEEE